MIDRGSGSYQDVVAPKKTGLSSLLDKAKGFLQEAVQQQRTKSLAERELYEDAPIVKPQTKDISTKFLDTTTENLLDNFLLQNENDSLFRAGMKHFLLFLRQLVLQKVMKKLVMVM